MTIFVFCGILTKSDGGAMAEKNAKNIDGAKSNINSFVTQDQQKFVRMLNAVGKVATGKEHSAEGKKAHKNLVDVARRLLNNAALSRETVKNNSAFIAGHFRGVFAKKFSKKSVVMGFEAVCVWLDLNDKQKADLCTTIKKNNIACSPESLNRFLPKPKTKEELFDEVDKNPTICKVMEYAKQMEPRLGHDSFAIRSLLHLTEKNKTVFNNAENQPSLFGHNGCNGNALHKNMIKDILNIVKKDPLPNVKLLNTLLMQTNCSDKEYNQLKVDFASRVDVIDNAAKEKRKQDCQRLNGFVANVHSSIKKDTIVFVSYRSLYVSMLYKSFVEGEDISAIDLQKEVQGQICRLNKEVVCKYRELGADDKVPNKGRWRHAINKVHKLIARDDSQKIDLLLPHIAKSDYIDCNSYELVQTKKNLQSLRGDENSLHYSLKPYMNHFEM